jgi:hypothetical protein
MNFPTKPKSESSPFDQTTRAAQIRPHQILFRIEHAENLENACVRLRSQTR